MSGVCLEGVGKVSGGVGRCLVGVWGWGWLGDVVVWFQSYQSLLMLPILPIHANPNVLAVLAI